MRSLLLCVRDALLTAVGLYCLKRLLALLRTCSSKNLPLPPAPPGRLLVGNLFDVPTGRAWLGWATHPARFGALSRLSIFGTHIIAVHSPRAARALFSEAHSNTFSDRPRIVFGGEMCGWDNILALLRYGPRLRMYRREVHQIIGTSAAIAKFHPLLEIETRRFLLRVLGDTTRLRDYARISTGAIVVRMAYGYHVEPSGRDPLIRLTEEGIEQISYAAQPGVFLVDFLPFLRYLPEWVPGAGFQRTAKRFRATVTELVEKPYAFVRQQMAAGTNEPSYVSSLIEKFESRGPLSPEDEHVIKWSAAGLYTGGAHTTSSAILSFFLAMLLNPHVLKRAQAEVDAVTGGTRLPTFKDRPHLPYVNAIVNEVLRWAPITPMGLPHVNTEDVEFEGHCIPKGSICMPNLWHFSHDPDVYSSPFEFRPERFLPRGWDAPTADSQKAGDGAAGGREPEPDVHEYVFGYGRRTCPGKELADALLFVHVAMTVAAFDIVNGCGPGGEVVEARYAFEPGTIAQPEAFYAKATPRSEAMAALIRSIEDEHPWDASDAEQIMHIDWRDWNSQTDSRRVSPVSMVSALEEKEMKRDGVEVEVEGPEAKS